MPKITQDEIWQTIKNLEDDLSLQDIRTLMHIAPEADVNFRMCMTALKKARKIKRVGRGVYRIVSQVKPVPVFSIVRERKAPFNLIFPKDFDTGMEMLFSEFIVIREGDLVLVGGVSNYGKTTVVLNFCGENIKYNPVLMGNEYTTRIGDTDEYEPTPRFLNRLDNMDWVQWTNSNGEDAFTLLPVRDDYAEHIIKDRINIIDWINLEGGRLYDISKVMDDIKAEIGRGIAIVVLQKDKDTDYARGRSFTKDFTDCELLIDRFTERESMLTIGKVKEYTQPVMGRKFAFGISQGVKIVNFREIIKCSTCYGKGWKRAGQSSIPCDECHKTGYVDK